jgi:hypothetical protein
MNLKENWNEIEKLTTVEKLSLIEEIVRSIKRDLEKAPIPNQNVSPNS